MIHCAALDCEFVAVPENGVLKLIPVSVGLVSRFQSFYRVLDIMSPEEATRTYEETTGSNWFRHNVLPGIQNGPVVSRDQATLDIRSFLSHNNIHHLGGWKPSLDVACMVAIFGGWKYMPSQVKKGVLDISIEAQGTGLTPSGSHHAMEDAKSVFQIWSQI